MAVALFVAGSKQANYPADSLDHNVGGGADRDGEHADPNGDPPSLVQYCTPDAKPTQEGVVHHCRGTLGTPQIASFGRTEILVRQPRPRTSPLTLQRTLREPLPTRRKRFPSHGLVPSIVVWQ